MRPCLRISRSLCLVQMYFALTFPLETQRGWWHQQDSSCSWRSPHKTAWLYQYSMRYITELFQHNLQPGLSFFYGGLVPRKSVLTIMMQVRIWQNFFVMFWRADFRNQQCLISIATTSIVWSIIGFSLAFGPTWGGSGFIGDPGSYPLLVGLNMCQPWPGLVFL